VHSSRSVYPSVLHFHWQARARSPVMATAVCAPRSPTRNWTRSPLLHCGEQSPSPSHPAPASLQHEGPILGNELSSSPPSAATAGSVRPFRSLSAKATAGKSLAQTTDRRVAHVIGASDLGKHFSRFPASKGFSSLMAGQLWLAPHDDASRFRTLSTVKPAIPLGGP